MGSSKSKNQPLRVLVIGARNAGKTHFLDMFYFGGDSTKIPTHGFNEMVVHQPYCKREVRLVEYGAHIEWASVFRAHKHDFDAIYLVMRSDAPAEEIMESNNALLHMCELLPHAVVAIIWNLVPSSSGEARSLQWAPRSNSSCVCYMDFSKVGWTERVCELFEWTIVNSNSAKKRAA
jgi:hypothetical protein